MIFRIRRECITTGIIIIFDVAAKIDLAQRATIEKTFGTTTSNKICAKTKIGRTILKTDTAQ